MGWEITLVRCDPMGDIWADYRRLREAGCVVTDDAGIVGAYTYDTVKDVLTNPSFRVEHGNQYRATRLLLGYSLIDRDGREHQQRRAALIAPLRSRRITGYRDALIRPIVDEVVDAVCAARGPVDLVHDLAMQIPAHVMCRVMGLPADDVPYLLELIRPLMAQLESGPVDFSAARSSRHRLRRYFRSTLEAGKFAPDCIVGQAAQHATAFASKDDLLTNLVAVLAAGTETTALAIGNLMACLIERPEDYARLREGAASPRAIVSESLRLHPALHFTERFAASDVLLVGGELVREGTTLRVCLASANRDESAFEHGDVWDIDRPQRMMALTFGIGAHVCPGMGLAYAEMEETLQALAGRVSAIRAAHERSIEREGQSIHSMVKLPATLQVA